MIVCILLSVSLLCLFWVHRFIVCIFITFVETCLLRNCTAARHYIVFTIALFDRPLHFLQTDCISGQTLQSNMIRLILMRAERRMATNGDKGSQREDIFVPNTVDLPQLGASSTQVSNCVNQVGWQEGARKLHELDFGWVTCRLIKRELLFPIHLDHWWPNCMRHFPGDGGKRVINCAAGIRWLKFCSRFSASENIPPSL